MEALVERLVAKHGTGTDKQLRARLARMAEQDQAVRTGKFISSDLPVELVREQEAVDDRLTRELKQIVTEKGWPTIALVGVDGSGHAALILTHSRDRDFQRAMVPRLQELAEKGEILGSSVAYVVDKILVSELKPQRFGTQFTWVNGKVEMLPVEDIAHLDERRDKYMLPSMAEYKRALADLYKMRID
jgi:hypothetical protein